MYIYIYIYIYIYSKICLAATVIRRKLYRVSCKKVYPTLKFNIQRFFSTKIIKNIQILHLNECNFDNYQFFPLMTFLGLLNFIELYLQ